jgi:hypothetical protein
MQCNTTDSGFSGRPLSAHGFQVENIGTGNDDVLYGVCVVLIQSECVVINRRLWFVTS